MHFMKPKKRVIVFSAHPDDLEIGCAGTCKKLSERGYEILSIITVRPSKEDNPKRTKKIVSSEMKKSYSQSNFKLKVFDTDLHKNGRPNLIVDNNTISKLKKYVENADIAILPNKNDYHQDHRSTFYLAYPLIKNVKEIWRMHSYPYCLHYSDITPNFFVDISKYWKFKKSLLECYSSALSHKDINNIKKINSFYGCHISSKYAEAFSKIKSYD